jgi:SAM-dependent methyltransferase
MLKMRAFRDAYLRPGLRVLDVGSLVTRGNQCYRDVFEEYDYVGMDLVHGPNVDLVPANPYAWTEVPTESFDVVVSGQMLEHNPFFWVTMAEISRVVRPGGHVCITAPSKGPVHRAPLDCWRFYPDSASAICAYAGLDLVESYVEPGTERTHNGRRWGDWVFIAHRPELSPDALARLRAIVATMPDVTPAPAETVGPAIEAFESEVAVRGVAWRWEQMRPARVAVKRVGHRLLRRS